MSEEMLKLMSPCYGPPCTVYKLATVETGRMSAGPVGPDLPT